MPMLVWLVVKASALTIQVAARAQKVSQDSCKFGHYSILLH
jgi:hypothetical protein